MKLLAIKICNKTNHVFCFDDEKRYPKTFVIQNNNANIKLITLPLESSHSEFGKATYSLMTEKGEIDVMVSSIKESTIKDGPQNMNRRSLTLKMIGRDFFEYEATNEQKKKTSDLIKKVLAKGKTPEEFDETTGEYRIHLDKTSGTSFVVTVILQIVDANGNIDEESCSCQILLAPAKMVFHATLDFGSEATQIMEYNQSDPKIGPGSISHIFRDMATLFNKRIDFDNHDSETNRGFIQFDEDERLYRSHYFAPKTVSITDSFNACSPINNKHIDFFCSYDDIDKENYKEKHFTLPNVKIASLMNQTPQIRVKDRKLNRFEDVTSFKNRFFYRSAINAFLYQIISDISYKARLADLPCAYVSLMVLMPNVYDQKQLGQRMRDLHSDMATIISSDDFKDIIGGVEINSISESDASILGYMNVFRKNTLLLNKGNYLIMDAGKGTLDFSVLHFNPEAEKSKQYTSLYRSGIVGSGNAISYAIFLDLMTMMLKEKNSSSFSDGSIVKDCIKRIIRELIANGDEYLLTEMMRYIDHYKCLISKNAVELRDEPKQSSSLSSSKLSKPENSEKENKEEENGPSFVLYGTELSLRNIVEWLKKQFSDPNRPLSSDKAYKRGELDYTERMIKNLSNDALKSFGFRGSIDYVIMTGRGFRMPQFRDAILNGLKSVDIWSKFKEMTFDEKDNGYNAKNICLFVNEMVSSGFYDGRIIGKPEHIKHGEDPFLYKPEEQKENTNGLQRWIKKRSHKKKAVKLFADGGGATVMSDDSYINGIPVDIKTPNDLICISGTYYRLPGNANEGDHAIIYFNGSEFTFVCNETDQEFGPVAQESVSHVYESLFPYGSVPTTIPLLDESDPEIAPKSSQSGIKPNVNQPQLNEQEKDTTTVSDEDAKNQPKNNQDPDEPTDIRDIIKRI